MSIYCTHEFCRGLTRCAYDVAESAQLAEERDQHLRTLGELATAKTELEREFRVSQYYARLIADMRAAHEATEVEVARLREDLACVERARRAVGVELDRVCASLVDERAAHEATKAEAEKNRAHWAELHVAMLDLAESNASDAHRAEARVAELVERHGELSERAVLAEARVAELERENTALRMTNRVEEADANDQRDRRRAAEARVAELEKDRDEWRECEDCGGSGTDYCEGGPFECGACEGSGRVLFRANPAPAKGTP